ncbi:MAG: RagB/SusD family nutrient uptake outer membrane protein, partial [Bacteroidales bacterium]|nr:RagB/SusD family nutrient uptake outer membrane protein [Bacteroidales bacterium]
NFRYYDLMRWKNGQAFKHQNLGLYFPGPGNYDLDGDGVIDHAIYEGSAPSGLPAGTIPRKIGTDIFLTEGNKGYVLTNPTDPGSWNEERDYYYPIPTDELSLNTNLEQNPNW